MAARKAARKKSAARAPIKSKPSAAGPGRANSNGVHQQESTARPWLEEHKWKPGQSGNPAGRPKGRSLEEAIRARLASPSKKRNAEEPDRIRLDDMAEMILRESIDHADAKITTAAMDRLWPKTDKVEHNVVFGDRMQQIRERLTGGEE